MRGRLSQADAEFYALEDSTTPTHIGSLAIFRRPAVGLDHEQLLAAVEEKLSEVPRYRQRVRPVPLDLGRPVWIDDRDFDITYHVRVSALPQPGSDDQLHDLVARLNSRPLDRERPLWEMYLIEGLSDGRMAVFTKSHLAIVDGRAGGLEIMQVLLTPAKRLPEPPEDMWMGQHQPSDGELVVSSVIDLLSRPKRTAAMVQGAIGEIADSVDGLREAVTGAAGFAANLLRSQVAATPVRSLNVPISRSRRYAVASMELASFRKLRSAYGCTVNDLLLSVVAGGLRTWLISRGEPISQTTQVQALVPIAVEDEGEETGTTVQAFLVPLPVAESNAVVRMRQIAHEAASQVGRNRQVAARRLATQGGFPASTMHAAGTRTAMSVPTKLFNILITNAPGPQAPVYLAGNELLEVYPVPPLVANQVVTIGITSYNGRVYVGLNADRDGMWDVVSMTEFLYEALEELAEAAKS
ncbi:wax ester/triacylglycerol synthase family O-acyltransferase [Tsukamurella sp. 8F]|uniref:WS/DGAT/MGAT family O-acyltransferase n=1 Tax=unclassified Tsukamurella TaxID=2633480 RepID=UPI0023BA0E74|nr:MULTISPECIES: wax ester/triacylglycerol synthase family O-acyltransferase [unclassified Tsukamurella]MDF0529050.1 wax ester/triacylglycerol synthase family O-acyltransferase [Tsukamurella sp. 8J]MDF0587423.1 wax ester/triacylglycerol synthase family O-acyltransferase [Tsukamurella sp. 8F]